MPESTLPQYRCRDCKSTSLNPRNLAVFIDGTSNKPGPKRTNVKKLYDVMFEGKGPEVEQRRFYLEGIGAYDLDDLPLSTYVEKTVSSGIEMMVAGNVNENVQAAYKWIAQNYKEGDQIYLFGFSRGAYQVRAVAGMIHEVGLVKDVRQERVEQAYRRYFSIDPNYPKTREMAVEFKKDFCWRGVRIHFIGVWDTVSSLGFVKKEVHITASASVTNACHFRHALALDERRVKFLPEYFAEMNAHRSSIQSPRTAVSDVKEVWFVGCHSDVGGTSRPGIGGVIPAGDEHRPVHSGNVTLVWMKREATANGLHLTSDVFAWNPEDVDLGREDSMNFVWKLFEYFPILHQVSFSGTGKHKRRSHLFHPRLIIPVQHLHSSVLPGDGQIPRATLACDIDLPMVSQEGSGGLWKTEPWASELSDESTTTHLLTSLLCDRQKTLASLGEVLLLLDFRLDNRHIQRMPIPEWLCKSIYEQSGFEKFVLTLIYDAISNSSTSDSEHLELLKVCPSTSDSKYLKLLEDARHSLNSILSSRNQIYPPSVLYFVRFSARHERLRQRFIAYDGVIDALMVALGRTAQIRAMESLFPLVADSLRYLIHDESRRDYVIGQLIAAETDGGPTRLSLALKVKDPNHLVASLKMIATLAWYPLPFTVTDQLKPNIWKLAKNKRGPVGSAAVEALVALGEPERGFRSVHFSNILGYLDNILPRLDAEVGKDSLPDAAVPASLPHIFQLNNSGAPDEKDIVMHKLLQAAESRDAHERTAATLTLLKLRQCLSLGDAWSSKSTDIFIKQLGQEESSLLAVYALNKMDIWTPEVASRAAEDIRTMFQKGWFDDAIGRVEGRKIFGELMTSEIVRTNVIGTKDDLVTNLTESLESGDRNRIRMSLICLDTILDNGGEVDLEPCITKSLAYLEKEKRNVQKKGVKILSGLAQTKAGEQAIKPYVDKIVEMLLPPPDGSPIPRWKLFGPTAAVYALCRNEFLRHEILKSEHYATLKLLRLDSTLYPQS